MNVLLLLLLSEPVWITTSTPPISHVPLACISVNEYVEERIRTATTAVRSDHFAEGLLLSLDKEERRSSRFEDENVTLRDSNQTFVAWIVALAVVATFVGVGGAALW